MYDQLKEYLNEFDFEIKDELWENIMVNSKFFKVKKDEILIQHGSIHKYSYFILSGILVTFIITEDGSSKAVWFGFDNAFRFITCPDSYFLDQATQYEIRALEDSTIIRFHKTQVDDWAIQFPVFNKIYFEDVTRVTTIIQELRSYGLSHTPLQFLKYLNRKYPVFSQRLPSKQMAQFLGISPEWYSKLKKKINIA